MALVEGALGIQVLPPGDSALDQLLSEGLFDGSIHRS
jgi:hypothetical protein